MEDLLTFALLGLLALLVVLDFAVPARRFPKVKWWRTRGIVSFVVLVTLSTVAPLFWDGFLGEHRLIDASGLGTAGGAIVGLLVAQLLAYGWHRLMHRTPILWRWLHQMHHSAERVDIWGAFYFSPLDVLGFAFVGSFALVFVLGVTVEAAILVNLGTTALAMFQHANLKTPAWLGYIVNRPENHALHHERGAHAFNYGDIALWDMVFGTWRNPKTWDGEAGFYDGASNRVGAMLIGRDVSEPAAPATVAPAAGLAPSRTRLAQ
jgi:sterol desaturase/sphingolipid hydroxylase (fatty acid hydroxylase superfamily)